jgi:hypothetical protein
MAGARLMRSNYRRLAAPHRASAPELGRPSLAPEPWFLPPHLSRIPITRSHLLLPSRTRPLVPRESHEAHREGTQDLGSPGTCCLLEKTEQGAGTCSLMGTLRTM